MAALPPNQVDGQGNRAVGHSGGGGAEVIASRQIMPDDGLAIREVFLDVVPNQNQTRETTATVPYPCRIRAVEIVSPIKTDAGKTATVLLQTFDTADPAAADGNVVANQGAVAGATGVVYDANPVLLARVPSTLQVTTAPGPAVSAFLAKETLTQGKALHLAVAFSNDAAWAITEPFRVKVICEPQLIDPTMSGSETYKRTYGGASRGADS